MALAWINFFYIYFLCWLISNRVMNLWIIWEMSAQQLFFLVFVVHHIAQHMKCKTTNAIASSRNKKTFFSSLFFGCFSSISSCNLFIVFFLFRFFRCARSLSLSCFSLCMFILIVMKEKSKAIAKKEHRNIFCAHVHRVCSVQGCLFEKQKATK